MSDESVGELREAEAAAELARLADEIAAHDRRYFQDEGADDLRRRLRCAEAPQRRHRGVLSSPGARQLAFAFGQRRRRGASRRASRRVGAWRPHALAGQRLHRRGGGRVRRPRAPLPAPGRGRGGLHRRAEDRRPLGLPALRGGRPGARRDARRRAGRRGRHRQSQDHRRDPPSPGRRRLAGPDRGARRDLSWPRRLHGVERRRRSGGEPDLCQSAQFGLRLATPDRPRGDGGAAAALLRLCLGAGQRPLRGDTERGAGGAGRLGVQGHDPDPAGQRRGRLGRSLCGDGGAATEADLRHRRGGVQGRPAGLAGAAGVRLALAALGDRAQVPGRAGAHHPGGDRHPGRPHGFRYAGGASHAGDRRRRGGRAGDAAQRRRDRAQGPAGRRHGDRPARRRRHPADPGTHPGRAAGRRCPVRISHPLSLSPGDAPGARNHSRRRADGGAPLHRRVRLPLPAGRAPQAFRLAPRLRHRGPRCGSTCGRSSTRA